LICSIFTIAISWGIKERQKKYLPPVVRSDIIETVQLPGRIVKDNGKKYIIIDLEVLSRILSDKKPAMPQVLAPKESREIDGLHNSGTNATTP